MQCLPLGFKILKSEEEIPDGAKRPVKDLDTHLSFCQILSLSRRHGQTIAFTKEDMWCFEPDDLFRANGGVGRTLGRPARHSGTEAWPSPPSIPGRRIPFTEKLYEIRKTVGHGMGQIAWRPDRSPLHPRQHPHRNRTVEIIIAPSVSIRSWYFEIFLKKISKFF